MRLGFYNLVINGISEANVRVKSYAFRASDTARNDQLLVATAREKLVLSGRVLR